MKNKGLFLLLLPSLLMLFSCNDEIKRTAEEDTVERNAYLSANNITESARESGLYFISTTEGTRFPAADGEFIIFSYVLKNIKGVQIDQSDEYYVDLSAPYLIDGVLEGISLMKEGGEATLIIPPELAYGSDGIEDRIDPNMTLIFELKLIEVKGPEEEAIRLQEYIMHNEIDVAPTDSGLYFILIDSGLGTPLKNLDEIKIKYKGYTLDGTVFDETTGTNYYSYIVNYSNVIYGFKEGVGMMKHGGKAKLIMPYNLAYGTNGTSGIYPYTTLIFEVEILE